MLLCKSRGWDRGHSTGKRLKHLGGIWVAQPWVSQLYQPEPGGEAETLAGSTLQSAHLSFSGSPTTYLNSSQMAFIFKLLYSNTKKTTII